jgi:hypothetical protein
LLGVEGAAVLSLVAFVEAAESSAEPPLLAA